MREYAYLLFNIMVSVPVAVVLLVLRKKISINRLGMLHSFVFVSFPFILWDIWASARGHWFFSEVFTLKHRIAGIPLEEFAFFFTVPLAMIIVWECIRVYLGSTNTVRHQSTSQLMKIMPAVLAVICVAAAVANFEFGYTRTVCFVTAVCVLVVGYSDIVKYRDFWIFQGVLLLLFVVSNTYLTALPIITYGSGSYMGLRIGTIPVEDFLFNYSFINLFLLVYTKQDMKKTHARRTMLLVLLVGLVLCAVVALLNTKQFYKTQDNSRTHTVTSEEQPLITEPSESADSQVTEQPVVSEGLVIVDMPVEEEVVYESSVYPIFLNTDQAGSIEVVVNKKHKLPSNYAPVTTSYRGAIMRAETAGALNSLFTGAEQNGLSPKIISAYRSYSTQVSVYGGYVNQYGQAEADTFSARPGHSEHQTGLAVDVGSADGSCDLDQCFGSTTLGSWIRDNAHTYGFIIRYPEGRDSATGYHYEPWHIRYVGVNIATSVFSRGITLDEYFSVPAGGY
jgi:lycopene cyclase domain-containing protein